MKIGKLSMIVIVALIATLFASCSASKSELVPGKFAGFVLSDYMDISTSTSVGGRILGIELDESTLLLHKEFAKGTKEFSVYVAKFENASRATGFWYGFVSEVSSELRSVISAIPWIYGELSVEIDESFMKMWFSGRWLYVFLGDNREEVNSAVKAFKEFEKSLVRSIES
ncbi:MAG: hypothetical protein JW697_07215 [Kosmotogaceae bacterium]|nr:hypothetical protein [Kosmotogaceae bacterium]